MTSKSHLSNEVGNLVAMTGRNPIHANSLSFPDHQSASYQISPALQPDALTATFSSSNDVGAPMVAPVTNPNGWAAKQDWARHQALIKQLYLDGKMPLAEVMSFMESQHGFKATSVFHVLIFPPPASLIPLRVKMYKTQIKRWGLDKKNKEFEMREIVRKRKQRADQGKRSIIRVRGQIRDFTEVVRYWDRKCVCIDDIMARNIASPTPETVECTTPVPSPIMTPQVLAIPELMFRCVRDYFNGSFESGTWIKTEPLYSCYSINDEENAARDPLEKLNCHCVSACSLFEKNLFHEAGQTMIAATAQFKEILLAEHPESLIYLFSVLIFIRDRDRDEIALIILRQFSALGKVLLSSGHPLSRICEWADSVYASGFDDFVFRFMKVMADQFESFVGPMHYSTLVARVRHINMAQKGNFRAQMLQNLLNECEKTLRPYDVRVLWVRKCLAVEYFHERYYVEAWTLSQRNIACSQHARSLRTGYEQDLSMVARCQYALGEVDLGIATLHKAIDSRMSRCGLQDCRAKMWLIQLEDWHLEQSHWSSAAQVRDWREKLLESIDED